MHERMESLDVLVRQVLPQVLPCPRGMVLDALQAVAVDFCKTSEVWSECLREDMQAGESVVEIGLASGVEIVRMRRLWLGDSPVDKDAFRSVGRSVLLDFQVPQDCTLAIDAVLRPSRMALAVPHALIEGWGDILGYGALARIKAMSGQHIEWSDGQGASIALQLYNEGKARARTTALRATYGRLSFAAGEVL